MIYIEIELEGTVTAKRCPRFVDNNGLMDMQSIRDYFKSLGYSRIGHIRLC